MSESKPQTVSVNGGKGTPTLMGPSYGASLRRLVLRFTLVSLILQVCRTHVNGPSTRYKLNI
jgi:hypothetical protein